MLGRKPFRSYATKHTKIPVYYTQHQRDPMSESATHIGIQVRNDLSLWKTYDLNRKDDLDRLLQDLLKYNFL